jgi:plasmid maintenance system antidote protein VapI
MTGDQLRQRIRRLGVTYTSAAALLGISRATLNHQMRGVYPVSRQTALLLAALEREAAEEDAAGAPVARHG